MQSDSYEKAWASLRRKLEKASAELPDKSPQKITVTQTLFIMDVLEPSEDDE